MRGRQTPDRRSRRDDHIQLRPGRVFRDRGFRPRNPAPPNPNTHFQPRMGADIARIADVVRLSREPGYVESANVEPIQTGEFTYRNQFRVGYHIQNPIVFTEPRRGFRNQMQVEGWSIVMPPHASDGGYGGVVDLGAQPPSLPPLLPDQRTNPSSGGRDDIGYRVVYDGRMVYRWSQRLVYGVPGDVPGGVRMRVDLDLGERDYWVPYESGNSAHTGAPPGQIAYEVFRTENEPLVLPPSEVYGGVLDSGRPKQCVLVPAADKVDTIAVEGEPKCSICLANKVACVAMPCTHASFCVACSRQLGERGDACPKCRAGVDEYMYVYLE